MKKIIIIIILCLIFMPTVALSQVDQLPIDPDPNKRPDECGDQCAKVSSDGYYIHLWYKEKIDRIKKDNETFSYYAIAKGITGKDKIHQYIYKSTDDNKFYITAGFFGPGEPTLISEKHYWVGEAKKDIESWDDTPQGNDQKYRIIGDSTYPTGIKDNVRYSWKIGTAGSIQLTLDNGTIYFVPDAEFQYYLDSEDGPPMIIKGKTNAEGKFSVSTENQSNELWLNEKRVKNFYTYTCFENNGQKYQIFKNINFPGDFHPHSDPEKAKTIKILDNIEIKLDQTNKVDVCQRTMQSSLGITQEITHGKNPWEVDVLNKVVCWLRNLILKIFYFEANLAGYFLRRNY